MLTIEDKGTGHALIQRSQPIHISISNCTSSSVRGTRPVRCSMPTTRGCFGERICILPSYSGIPHLGQKRAIRLLLAPHLGQSLDKGGMVASCLSRVCPTGLYDHSNLQSRAKRSLL